MIRGSLNCRTVFTCPLLEKPKEFGNELISAIKEDPEIQRSTGKRESALESVYLLLHIWPIRIPWRISETNNVCVSDDAIGFHSIRPQRLYDPTQLI